MASGLVPRMAAPAAILLLALCAIEAPAFNVRSFTSATIRQLPQLPPGPPGTDPIPLDLDPNNPPNDATRFSIPRGAILEIVIKGIADSAKQVGLDLMDDDSHEFLAGNDDILDETGTPFPLQPGEEFELKLHCFCNSSFGIDGEESSGEQSAEAYVRDGQMRIPMDQNLAGGKKKKSWWTIDCDKDSTRDIAPSGLSMHTAWGDKLVIPPGALSSTVSVRIANMYPLLHVEAVPDGFLPISEALSLEPDGLALNVPAELTFQYTREEAGETADEATLEVLRYDPALAKWQPIPGESVDPVQHQISVSIPAFATYGFAARKPEPAHAAQSVQTDFGNNDLGLLDHADGSELDGGYALVQNGALWLLLTGNLESNFNKLEVFIDCLPGGQNRLRGDNPDLDFNGLNRMGDDGSGNGLRFDTGFDPDFWIGLAGGDDGNGEYRLYANYSELLTGGGGSGSYLGSAKAARNGVLTGGTNPYGIRANIDNSNVGGLDGGCGPGVGDSVTTGIQLMIPLEALGNPTGCPRVCALINGSSHDFISNQVIGSLAPGTCNLGDPRLVNLASLAGEQSFQGCAEVVGIVSQPGAHRARISASPNPFRDEVHLRIDGMAGELRADIFDVAGRRVARRTSTAGTVTWDGRGDDGTVVPAGSYVARLSGRGFQEAVRLLKLR